MDPQDDRQHFRARVVNLVEDHQSKECKLDNHHKFCISVNDDQYEEVITYNELMDFIQKNEENDAIFWHFWWII
jgi:ribosomal protein L14E/L6E/L27E